MNNKDILSWRYVIYILLFMATSAVTFVSMHYQSESAITTDMTEATFPIVMIESADGLVYNPMHGYRAEVNNTSMDLPLTPLPANNRLGIAVDTYGNTITDIAYKIRDSRDMSLIEDTSLNMGPIKLDRAHAELSIKDLLVRDVEYILEISISTLTNNDIKYYTRLITNNYEYFNSSVDFVMQFNNDTYDLANTDNIKNYIETKYDADNSNYGSVDIYCSHNQIIWGDINPFVESNVIPTIEDIQDEILIISLDYTIGSEGYNGDYDTYMVHEYYRVRQGTTGMYLLQFKRETNQIFDGEGDLFASGKIVLGIQSQLDAQAMDSNNNEYTCFVNQGNLWSYSKSANEFIKVFTFESEDTDNLRERLIQHNIKIMDISDSGDIQFIVYGYMNRGVHEGEMGVSLYNYTYGGNIVEELLYIPLDIPYEVMLENVGDVAYINSDSVFYISICDSLYAIELNSREIMTEITGLSAGSYMVSDSGRIIAYSMESEEYNTRNIRIFNLEKSDEHIIEAPAGEYIKVVGFIENDCIYGAVKCADIDYNENGMMIYPMYALTILSEDYQLVKAYRERDVYISDAQVDGYRLNLTRVVKSEDGYKSTTVDQLISKEENSIEKRVTVDSVYTTARKTEVVLVLPKGVGDINNVTVRSAANIQFADDKKLLIDDIGKPKQLYYVFGAGSFKAAYKDINSAVMAADRDYGYVVDYDGKLVWTKYKRTSSQLKGIDTSRLSGTAYNDCVTYVKEYMAKTDARQITIHGAAVQTVIPLINMQRPVLVKLTDGYGIIVGYDSTTLTYYYRGREYKVTYDDASKLFTKSGNIYIAFY